MSAQVDESQNPEVYIPSVTNTNTQKTEDVDQTPKTEDTAEQTPKSENTAEQTPKTEDTTESEPVKQGSTEEDDDLISVFEKHISMVDSSHQAFLTRLRNIDRLNEDLIKTKSALKDMQDKIGDLITKLDDAKDSAMELLDLD